MVGKVYHLDHQPKRRHHHHQTAAKQTPPAGVGGDEDAPGALGVVVANPVVALNSKMNQNQTPEKMNS